MDLSFKYRNIQYKVKIPENGMFSSGYHGIYIPWINGLGLKLIIRSELDGFSFFSSEHKLKSSLAYENAKDEFKKLKRVPQGLAPKAFELTIGKLNSLVYPLIIMENIDGPTLALLNYIREEEGEKLFKYIDKKGYLSTKKTKDTLPIELYFLKKLKKFGFLSLDIHDENIMVTDDNELF